MLDRPRLRGNLSVATVAPDKLFISDGSRQSLIEGEVAVALAPLLDGELTTPEIVARLSRVPIGAVLGTLNRLERLDYLVDGGIDGAHPAAAAHWDAARVGARAASASTATITLEAVGAAPVEAVRAALERAGLETREMGGAASAAGGASAAANGGEARGAGAEARSGGAGAAGGNDGTGGAGAAGGNDGTGGAGAAAGAAVL